MPDSLPETIGRYEIKGLVARGGMGRLYLARDPNTSRLVILKLLDATLDSHDLRDRFDREARALASLNHPNIVHIYDYGDFRDSPFIVMEYVRGETLEEKISRRASLSVVQKLRLMSELCAGLAHAHEASIIHRDVKPANLMIDQDGRLKILDFGIARVSDSNLTRITTQAGLMQLQIGTPGYMSPEQMQGGEIDQRSDVFAVGAVAYELFAGRPAFPGSTPKEIERQLMMTPPAPLATELAGLDPQIDVILSRALAKDRSHRYQDATALGEAFESCRQRLQPSNTPPTRRPTPPATPARQSPAARAEAACVRAIAAYEDKAFDLARRCAIEALAEDPGHAGARALMARLDPGRTPPPVPRTAGPVMPPPATSAPSRMAPPAPPAPPRGGSEVISTDPTVLISRASQSPPPRQSTAQIEPTIIIRREDLPPRSMETDETVIATPRSPRARSSSETMATGRNRGPAPPSRKPAFSVAAYLQPVQALWLRLKSSRASRPAAATIRPAAARSAGALPRGGGFRTSPMTRGAAIAVAAFLVAGIAVLGAVRLGRWMWPTGQTLTLMKPVGGTIVGAGLTCGTRGSDCSTDRANGEPVEFDAQADAGYLFSGFTGDCAPTGRMFMSGPRTCGANFTEVVVQKPVTWPLTITKPTGGTVIVAGGIFCGTLGAECTIEVPDGKPVTLGMQPDDNFTFISYTGDCGPNGERNMTAALTCGAIFAQSAAPTPVPPVPPAPRPPTPLRINVDQAPSQASKPITPGLPAPSDPPPTPPIVTEAVPTAPAGKVEDPISAEAHAKEEIQGLVKLYCAEQERRQPDGIIKLFPRADRSRLREQFRQYKLLTCSVTSPLEYVRLDARPAGAAQIKFDMKQVITMQSGGAPQVQETIVTMKVSRNNFNSPWLIDDVNSVVKPKP